VLLLFASTMFLSAALLFSVEPMVAKMTLPLVGGSPAVWGTCMVFFQAALLGGYTYAHATTSWLGVRRQAILHAGLILLPLFVLPIGITLDSARSLPPADDPSGWLLGLLLAKVGLPFFVVSTSAPILQRWFASTRHPAAADPYFLYGASNFGSLLALLAYPAVLEPSLRLAQQSGAWAAGYGLLVALTLACAMVVWRGHAPANPVSQGSEPAGGRHPLQVGLWLHWMALAFIPSSLMLGVTMYLTTDIAAIPLLWVIPLALYLLTFILTFARRPIIPHSWMVRALPMAVVLLALAMSVSSVTQPIFIPLHLVTFFLAAMACHGELVRLRPPRERLTAFYLAMSCGGALGGFFNALVAPIVFNRVAEYPLALVLACLALPKTRSNSDPAWHRLLDWSLPAILGALAWGLIALLQPRPESPQDDLGIKFVIGLAVFACYTFKDRPVRFALGLGAVLLAGGTYTSNFGRGLYQHRDYFGVLRVTYIASGNYHRLIHGHTVHGQQGLDPERRHEPLTYFHRTGPIGQVFDVIDARIARSNVAIIGLGAGTLACYAQPGQRWTFYEIDPIVAMIARNPRYFTFLAESRAASTQVVLGDARLKLRDSPEHGYGLIVLDAFSSDAIPTHLLTREALRLYRGKLAQGGILAFHISNKYINLIPVLGALARDANMNCLVRRDLILAPDVVRNGKEPSIWAVVFSREDDLEGLEHAKWEPPLIHRHEAVWTDDFSNTVNYLMLR
jgi:hypothetical protein